MATSNLDALRLPEQHLAEHECDPQAGQRGYIKGTDYSTPYTSAWSRVHPEESTTLLRHLSCSYLSTHGVPPTLLSLKQHAQALCNLILTLSPSANPGEIGVSDNINNNNDSLAVKHNLSSAFDFLADLRQPYTNPDPDHQLPLNSLVNEVASKTDLGGTQYHCALHTSPAPRREGTPLRPYENHHNLLLHANDCLERLDHEFSPEGGLMAVLPGDDDGEQHESADRLAARNTLLGQWLGFVQHLVRRSHELEIAYGNALDMVEADAALPLQVLSSLGPDGRTVGRQIAFPQDRWVLANAGDDVWGYIHKLLDAREAVNQEKERMWREQGVSGERMWRESKDGAVSARGIVAINVATRYYRLAGGGHGTVFVVPAWEVNPAVEYTRLLEKKPGVVGVPMGKWPERVSEIEKRFEGVEKKMGEREAVRETGVVMSLVAERASLSAELERLENEVEVLEEYLGEEARVDAQKVIAARAQLKEAIDIVEQQRYVYREEIKKMQKKIDALKEAHRPERARGGRSRSATAGRA